MAMLTPIPQGGGQGVLYTTMLTAGSEQIRPGTDTVFIGQTLGASLTLVLPAAKGYAAGRSIIIGDAIRASTCSFQVLVAPRSSDQINGGSSPLVALSGVGSAQIYSDGVSSWNFDSAALTESSAPIRPFSAYLANIQQFYLEYDQYSCQVSLYNVAYLDPALLVAWITQCSFFGETPIQVICLDSSNAISNTEAILDAIAYALTSGSGIPNQGQQLQIYFANGGGNAPAPPADPHEDATLTIQLPAPTPANAGIVLGITGALTGAITFDSTINFSATSGSGDAITIGVENSPSMSQVVTYINANQLSVLNSFGISTINQDGSASGFDTYEDDYPINAVGSAVVSSNPGVVAVPNQSIATITGFNGSTVSTN